MLHRSTQQSAVKYPESAGKSAEHAAEIAEPSETAAEARCRRALGQWWIEGLADGEEPPELAPLALDEFLRIVAGRNNRAFWRVYDDPSKREGHPQDYRSPCCLLVAYLKGRSEFQNLSGLEAAQLVEKTFPKSQDPWAGLELPEHDTFDNELDPRDDVIDQWRKITRSADLDLPSLNVATDLAEQYPLMSDRYTSTKDKPYRRLVSLCYWLARVHRDKPFFLSYRVAGERIGVSHVQAGRYLERATDEGLLNLQKTKTPRTSAGKKLPPQRLAREYRFDVEAALRTEPDAD